ncbi:hypothetical protein GCM10008013_19290 [Paenibacillus segetis]|uniref:Uncharacterized protein n=1 Tax=Paenibacillus segetis TaxID=1325360 RepID=A0ABQ1YCV5_9BACL|nr:hypothetical protein GCM10008013_19290 [Paenibacillus segetis]
MGIRFGGSRSCNSFYGCYDAFDAKHKDSGSYVSLYHIDLVSVSRFLPIGNVPVKSKPRPSRSFPLVATSRRYNGLDSWTG